MKGSFLCIHEYLGRIWACECLDGVFRGMRRSHSIFHYERIRGNRVLKKEGVLSHVKVT